MRSPRGLLVGCVLLGLALRLGGIGFGLPSRFVPDTHAVRGALRLGETRNPFLHDEGGTTYPYVLPYVLLGAYGGLYAGGRITGRFSSLEDFRDLAFDRPGVLHLIARIVVALFGAATVAWVYALGLRFGGRGGAVFAGLLFATSLLSVHLSHQERPHTVMVCFAVAAVWASVRMQDRGRLRDALLAGLLAGLACGSLQSGILVLAAPAAAWLARPRGRRGPWLPAVALGGFTAAFVLAEPYVLSSLSAAATVDPARGAIEMSGGQRILLANFTGEGFGQLAGWLLGHEPLTCLAAAGGIVLAWRRGEIRSWLPLLAAAAAFFLVFGLYGRGYPRYALPLVPFLCVAGGVLLGSFAELALRATLGFRAAVVILGMFLAVPLGMSLRLDLLLMRSDTRELARDWITHRVPPGTRVALGRGGPDLPPDRDSLEWQDARLGEKRHKGLTWDPLGARERRLLAMPEDRFPPGGYFVIPLWKFLEAGAQGAAAEVLEEAGAEYVVLAAPEGAEGPAASARPRAPSAVTSAPAPAVAPAALRKAVLRSYRLVRRVDPGPGWIDGRETSLPLDMWRPWRALLGVSRPGPPIEIFRRMSSR